MTDKAPTITDLDEMLADQVLHTLGNSCYLDLLETSDLHNRLPQLYLHVMAGPASAAVDVLPDLVELSRALTRHAFASRRLAVQLERVRDALRSAGKEVN
jgi:hypothetical protein